MYNNYTNNCRLCLTHKNLIDIKSNSKDNLIYIEKIEKILPKPAIETEIYYPKFICISCADKVDICFNFIQECLQSYEILQTQKYTDTVEVTENFKTEIFIENVKEEIIESNSNSSVDIKDNFIAIPPLDHHVSNIKEDEQNYDENKEIDVPLKKKKTKCHKCEICSKLFYYPSDVVKHRRIHEKEIFPCNTCGKIYSRLPFLKKHQLTHVPNVKKTHENSITNVKPPVKRKLKEKRYKCEICNKLYQYPSDLIKHQRIHSGDKPFICHICGKNFTQYNTLERHLDTHNDTKLFKCSKCSRAYKRKYDRALHERTHTGVKLFTCEICQKSFYTMKNLQFHKKVHTDEKPYTCLICNKSFKFMNNLKTHKLVHTSEKSHLCKLCGKDFSRVGDLKKHYVVHTKIKPYKCVQCSKSFRDLYRLKIHQENHKINFEIELS